MSAAPPAILLAAVVGLFGLGAVGLRLARADERPISRPGPQQDRVRPIIAAAGAVCAVALAVLLLATIADGAAGAPLMLSDTGIGVVLDQVNLPPLLIAFGGGLATLAFGWGGTAGPMRRDTLLVGPLAAGWALALLAADALTLMLGLLAASLTLWATTERRGDAAGALLVALLASLAALLLAFDVLIGAGGGLSFAALRALPPSGWRAGLVLLAMLASLAIQAAWVPRLPLPSPASVLTAAVLPAVLLYLAMRVLLDLAGPAQPLAWGVPILLLGIGLGAVGAWRAILAPDLTATLAAATGAQAGLSLIGVGVVAMARAADQPDLAAFALAGTLVQVLAHAAFKTLLTLGSASVRDGAGIQAWFALGGLSRGMPVTSVCLLVGAVSLASLPLSGGFAGLWMLLQSLYAVARLGGAAIQLLALAAALVAGGIGALLAHAALRLVGIGLLGRPRTPRTAAATEPPRAVRTVLVALAILVLAVGVWPAALFVLAAPAVRALTSTSFGLAETWLAIAPPPDTAGYAPLGLAALFAGVWLIVFLVRRGIPSPAARQAPGWAGGYAPPPAWLPFGDPALQIDAASFSAGLATAFVQAGHNLAGVIEAAAPSGLRPAVLRTAASWRPVLRRYRAALRLAALLLALLALAVIEAT